MNQALRSELKASLTGKIGFNRNAGSGKRRSSGLNTRQQKAKDLLLNELVQLGWTAAQDQGDDEITLVKHLFNDANQKRRSVLQLLSSPSFGTGLYMFRKSQYTFDLKEVQNPVTGKQQMKLSCFDFDAYAVPDSNLEFVTVEDMGKDKFLAFLLDNGFIKQEEVQYFDSSSRKRKEFAKALPSIILDVISPKDVPQVAYD